MTGKEIIDFIKKNNYEEMEFWVSVDGNAESLQTMEPLFPRLSNTNEVVLTDGNEVEYDKQFWEKFYGGYMNFISKEEADKEFHSGHPSFYILYCDGTEGQIDTSITKAEWNRIKSYDVLFGHEN